MQNWQRRLLVDSAGGYSANQFVTTWATTSSPESITLPLRSGFSYDFTVDWGDGNSDTITAWDDADKTHEYATAGTYTVVITGTCEAWYFNNGGSKLNFRTVEWWGASVGFTGDGLRAAFRGCTNATGYTADPLPAYAVTSLAFAWNGNSSVTSFPAISALTSVTNLGLTWQNCSKATSFPAVSALTSVTTLASAWYGCSSASSLPAVNALTLTSNLSSTWQGCSGASSFPAVSALTSVTTLLNAWRGCSSAASFPDVNALTSVTTIQSAWYGCTGCTAVPVLPSASTALVTTTNAMWTIGAGMSGTVGDLWNAADYPNISSYANTFTGCTGLTNYADIPDAWKGL